jgi:acylphosphatase
MAARFAAVSRASPLATRPVPAAAPKRHTRMKREVVVLTGRVQAVGFRECVLDTARRFPVAGTVRNLRSGMLEIDAEGDDADVDAFIAAVLAEPPALARIDHVVRRSATPNGATGFRRVATG